jgi:hypothetical protein
MNLKKTNKQKHKKRNILQILSVVKKKSRNEEFIQHGKSISYANVEKNKKKYTRKMKHKKNKV